MTTATFLRGMSAAKAQFFQFWDAARRAGTAECAGPGRTLGGVQNLQKEEKRRQKEQKIQVGRINTREQVQNAHHEGRRIAPRIPPALWNLVWDV